MRITCVLVIAFAFTVYADDTFENSGVRVALKLYDECSKADEFTPCLKKKAITFLDRLGRMEKLSLSEGITVVRGANEPSEPIITEDTLEATLPRSSDAQDAALSNMLMDKVSSLLSSRTIQVTMPKFTAGDLDIEEGRKKKGGMMGGMMMGIAAKMAALIPVAIAGLFLLAGKALITAKIALLLAGIIAIKKLVASKHQHGGGGGHGGWQSSGGGWDKRSFENANKIAYSAYSPK